MSLDLLLDNISQERQYVDRATGLHGTDEDIRFRDQNVRSLHLNDEEYYAPTYADLLRRIAEDHGCLSLEMDGRRRNIELWLEGALDCASVGTRGIACQMEHCPEQ